MGPWAGPFTWVLSSLLSWVFLRNVGICNTWPFTPKRLCWPDKGYSRFVNFLDKGYSRFVNFLENYLTPRSQINVYSFFSHKWPSFAMEPIRLPTGCSGGILSPFHLLNFWSCCLACCGLLLCICYWFLCIFESMFDVLCSFLLSCVCML